jgi:hypothetical protein
MEVIELSSGSEAEEMAEAEMLGAEAAPVAPRKRREEDRSTAARVVSLDLTGDDMRGSVTADGGVPAATPTQRMADPAVSTAGASSSSMSAPTALAPSMLSQHHGSGNVSGSSGSSDDTAFVMIDLCDEDEDEEGGSFARSLNLLFEGEVEICGETSTAMREAEQPRKRCKVLDGSSRGGGGGGGASSSVDGAIDLLGDSDDEEDEDEDARMARRIQAQLDADAAEEAARGSKGASDDEALAQRLQERLAREIADSEEGDAPTDVLRAQRNRIRDWLMQNATQLHVRDVWSNPAAAPGGALYARFAAAYEAAKEKAVRLCFHGTAEANIDAICQHGLDPKYRGKNGQALGAGEYFAERPDISLPYCAGGRRMIVFAVLMDQAGLTKRQSGIVVINKVEHQLYGAAPEAEELGPDSVPLSLAQPSPHRPPSWTPRASEKLSADRPARAAVPVAGPCL